MANSILLSLSCRHLAQVSPNRIFFKNYVCCFQIGDFCSPAKVNNGTGAQSNCQLMVLEKKLLISVWSLVERCLNYTSPISLVLPKKQRLHLAQQLSGVFNSQDCKGVLENWSKGSCIGQLLWGASPNRNLKEDLVQTCATFIPVEPYKKLWMSYF